MYLAVAMETKQAKQPIDTLSRRLAANWIFHLTELRLAPEYSMAVRRSLFLLSAIPNSLMKRCRRIYLP